MGKEDRSRKGRKNCESCEKTGNGNGLGESGTWRTGQLLPGIVFIGGFLFHLVWEAKGQYSVVYFMLLLPYAYLGMERVADVFLDVTGAGKE
mgnify:CR=1 FL=1